MHRAKKSSDPVQKTNTAVLNKLPEYSSITINRELFKLIDHHKNI